MSIITSKQVPTTRQKLSFTRQTIGRPASVLTTMIKQFASNLRFPIKLNQHLNYSVTVSLCDIQVLLITMTRCILHSGSFANPTDHDLFTGNSVFAQNKDLLILYFLTEYSIIWKVFDTRTFDRVLEYSLTSLVKIYVFDWPGKLYRHLFPG